MFLLNNIRGRNHREIYETSSEQSAPIFDMTEKQINLSVNTDWNQIREDDLVCIVSSTQKMNTVYKIDLIERVEQNQEDGNIFVVRGHVVAKFPDELRYTGMLNKYGVEHEKLKKNKFSIGFNVANLGDQMDSALIKSKHDAETLGELKMYLEEEESQQKL